MRKGRKGGMRKVTDACSWCLSSAMIMTDARAGRVGRMGALCHRSLGADGNSTCIWVDLPLREDGFHKVAGTWSC